MYSGKPQGTSHELAPELRVEQTCENNHKVNLDLFNDIFKYFVFQFLHENEKRKMNCISFSIFYDNEKRMRALKIQSKNLLNMKMAVNPCMESIIQKINFLKNENCIFLHFSKI